MSYSKYGTKTVDGTVSNRTLQDVLTDLDTQYGSGKGKMDEETYKGLRKAAFESEYTPSSFNMDEFEGLLGKLESSKMKQQRQKSVEGRRDIMAGGMAGMLSNF
jgi:hypothetical protein